VGSGGHISADVGRQQEENEWAQLTMIARREINILEQSASDCHLR